MERILLIEPNYKNKYPPIGLMKIATYYKQKGDYVQFHKGLMPMELVAHFDKVMVTTLFTFDFDVCISTINYYIAIKGITNVFVGGIAATIMPEKFREAIPGLIINTGQLISSKMLGYDDDINIDILELDYDILWDIEYDYPAADSYFIYTTRGCPRKCSFCAVKTLEPVFYDCDNLVNQIERVDQKYGIKKNLLIMDNNILYSDNFERTITELIEKGFGKSNNKIKKANIIKYYISSLETRVQQQRPTKYLIKRMRKVFGSLNKKRIKRDYFDLYNLLVCCPEEDSELINLILERKEEIVHFFDYYDYHKITRYVDFNQGLDARLMTVEKAKLLGSLALKPCRIAFDDIKTKQVYEKAMTIAVENGVKYFSNYLLYNYKDKPEDLWNRLLINIDFRERYAEKGISLFSFPMKYASIEHTDRSYIGIYWNNKFLKAINVILNVTSGVVAKERDFFYRAFGKTPQEFIEILSMPDDFIRFRDFFEENGFSSGWRLCYSLLSEEEKHELINIVSSTTAEELETVHTKNHLLDLTLVFYSIKKSKYLKNQLFYDNMLNKITSEVLLTDIISA